MFLVEASNRRSPIVCYSLSLSRRGAFLNSLSLKVIVAAIICVLLFLCVKAFVPPHIALAGTVLVAIVQAIYLAWLPRELPDQKPRWSWFPKYHFQHLISGPSGLDGRTAITRRLGEIGFSIQQEKDDSTKFTRGHPKGDFAIELAKVDVTVTFSEGNSLSVLVEYGWVCLFDTGDLWRFSSELRRHLAE